MNSNGSRKGKLFKLPIKLVTECGSINSGKDGSGKSGGGGKPSLLE